MITDVALALDLQRRLRPLIAARPTASHRPGLLAVADALEAHFHRLGFEVDRRRVGDAPDVLIAIRAGRGERYVGLSGHYDVEEEGEGWRYPAFDATIDGGRLYGRGTADNLGPLLLRLVTLEGLDGDAPPLVWILQGQEEVGSTAAHSIYPVLKLPPIDLWLEETGYFERDGRQRMLARRLKLGVGAGQAGSPSRAERCVMAVQEVAARHGRQVDVHDRHMNKVSGEQGCPFLAHLAQSAAYLAIGPNDPDSRIHRPDESLPLSNLAVSHEQLRAALRVAAEVT